MSPNVLIAGWAGSGNLGDELICGSLADLLRRRGAEVAMFSEDPAATEELHGVRAFPTRSLREPRRWADGVVLGPGGLLQDQTSAISCAVHLGRYAAVGAGRARAGIGLGVGPIDRWPSRWAFTPPHSMGRDGWCATDRRLRRFGPSGFVTSWWRPTWPTWHCPLPMAPGATTR